MKIRVNELARELEIKSNTLLKALLALGIDKKDRASALTEDEAAKVREYFQFDYNTPLTTTTRSGPEEISQRLPEVLQNLQQLKTVKVRTPALAANEPSTRHNQPTGPPSVEAVASARGFRDSPQDPTSLPPVRKSCPPGPTPPTRTQIVASEPQTDWTVELGRLRRMLDLDLLDELSPRSTKREEFSKHVTRACFAEEKMPPRIARLMQAIGEFRNEVEHQHYTLSPAEERAVEAIWFSLAEWAEQRGLRAAAKMMAWKSTARAAKP